MKVKARKNLIYDGTFRKAGEVFKMSDADAKSYEQRHWVLTPSGTQTKSADVPAALPPLTPGKKK